MTPCKVDNDGESDTESNRTVTIRCREEDVVGAGSEVEPFEQIPGAADDEGEASAGHRHEQESCGLR